MRNIFLITLSQLQTKLHTICANLFGRQTPMFIHHNLDDSELIDLLAIHTDRLILIMTYGETYTGEYRTCKSTIELLQKEIISRKGFFVSPLIKRNRPGIRL